MPGAAAGAGLAALAGGCRGGTPAAEAKLRAWTWRASNGPGPEAGGGDSLALEENGKAGIAGCNPSLLPLLLMLVEMRL